MVQVKEENNVDTLAIDSDVLGDKRLILVFTYERIDYCT
jgi:hypothetical protein